MIPLLTTHSTILCPHGGSVVLVPSQTLCQVAGAPVLLQTDVFTVVGCPFQKPTTPPVPSPCVSVRWLSGATQTKVNQVPVLLQTSAGLCSSAEQLPQGPPTVVQTQSQARGQ